MIYEPVLVGFDITPLDSFNVTVPDATVLLAHTVNVTAAVLVAMLTLLVLPLQLATMVMPVDVTLARLTPASVPNAFVTGSNVYDIVWPAVVDEGFVKTMVLAAVCPGRESLKVSLTDVKLAAWTVSRYLNPTLQASRLTKRPNATATVKSFLMFCKLTDIYGVLLKYKLESTATFPLSFYYWGKRIYHTSPLE